MNDIESIATAPEPRLREAEGLPDLSVVVPVNAQSDLGTVRALLGDLARYDGPHTFETVLLVNNFPPGHPPSEVKGLERAGARVVAIGQTRKPGEAIVFSARMAGVRAARADLVVNFDADCRVPDPTALLGWYARQFRSGAQAAYTPVAYHDFDDALSVRCYFAIHHASRWIKRVVFGVPTTRGSNYAVRRGVVLDLYERGLLADDMNVGPTFKKLAGRVAYGSGESLTVLTSGRMFEPGWSGILPYFLYRLRYNLRVLPVKAGVADRTGRDADPISRYQYVEKAPATADDL